MIELTVTEDTIATWIHVKGRVDSMTAPEIQQKIDALILGGKRILVADLSGVSYISSAGLRIFVMSQKQLKNVDGEVILYGTPDPVRDVFMMSGFGTLFRIASTGQEIEGLIQKGATTSSFSDRIIDDISFQFIEKSASPGNLRVIGCQDKLPLSQYTVEDVNKMKADSLEFGTGLAALGENYEEYKHYFGESLILNRSFFYYPAVKHPAVDFMFCTGEQPNLEYNFFHGFGFSGAYKYILSFEGMDGLVQLQNLVNALFGISSANIIGIVMLAESKGFWGMNLKKVPISENRPENGKDICDAEKFASWMNFPVEPAHSNHIIAAVGVAVKHGDNVPQEVQSLVAGDNNFHFHAGVFEKQPLNRNIESFDKELTRVITECEVSRIQHVLGKTKFSNGMIGLIELG
ncbi:MAG: STAS domain-containing protein [Deltaproteobacteria bacterium]|nr:STAS domain-containing protein [Deltaproteobacteria bacterium]